MAVKISRVADRSPGGPRSYLFDPERLAAALGAAVGGAVGVAALDLVVAGLAVAVLAPMDADGALDRGRGVERRLAHIAGRRGRAALRRLRAGGRPGLVLVELAVGRSAPDHRTRARAQQGGTERGSSSLTHVHVLPRLSRLSRRKPSSPFPAGLTGNDSNRPEVRQ